MKKNISINLTNTRRHRMPKLTPPTHMHVELRMGQCPSIRGCTIKVILYFVCSLNYSLAIANHWSINITLKVQIHIIIQEWLHIILINVTLSNPCPDPSIMPLCKSLTINLQRLVFTEYESFRAWQIGFSLFIVLEIYSMFTLCELACIQIIGFRIKKRKK